MSGFYRTLEYVAIKMNNAANTKQSIITAANSYEFIMQKVKEIEENSLNGVGKEKNENLEFDPNEIQAIVLKNTNLKNKTEDKEER